MKNKVMKIHPGDNVLVALTDLAANETVEYNGNGYTLITRVPAKHKFVMQDMKPGDEIFMYGVLVGKAEIEIPKGSRITTSNVRHAASGFEVAERKTE
ncbi:MAG TPA: UxaA family hydrolase, partial [Hanamia sp.]|nr:UxaA family hydrolase [Hanamia sp.]